MTWNRKSEKKNKRKNQYFLKNKYITTGRIVKKISNGVYRVQGPAISEKNANYKYLMCDVKDGGFEIRDVCYERAGLQAGRPTS